MYDILGDKYLLKSANSILVLCNKQGQLVTVPVLKVTHYARMNILLCLALECKLF